MGRSSYDADKRVARLDLTMFRLAEGAWHRTDLALLQRAYTAEEVRGALGQAGFRDVKTFDAERDLQLAGGVGRTFFLAHG